MSLNDRSLNFSEIEAKAVAYLPKSAKAAADQRSRWIWLVALGFTIAFLAGKFGAGQLAKACALVGLAIEAIGALGVLNSIIREAVAGLRHYKRTAASELDHEFAQYSALIGWLQGFDATERANLVRYLRMRITSMEQRMALLLGSLERLGALPLIVALYLQIRDMDLNSLPTISVSTWVFGSAIAAIYGIGYWAASIKMRWALYERALIESLERSTGVSKF